jgi:hypothetical protein
MKQQWRRERNRDWTYSEGCGCRVTFIAESNYKTSKMFPGEACERHRLADQMMARDIFIDRARQALKEYLEIPLE